MLLQVPDLLTARPALSRGSVLRLAGPAPARLAPPLPGSPAVRTLTPVPAPRPTPWNMPLAPQHSGTALGTPGPLTGFISARTWA